LKGPLLILSGFNGWVLLYLQPDSHSLRCLCVMSWLLTISSLWLLVPTTWSWTGSRLRLFTASWTTWWFKPCMKPYIKALFGSACASSDWPL